MASMFNTLHIGYSGLNAAQVGISTTGHNIANAETEGYTRQRAVASAATPISSMSGQVGNGVEIKEVKRVFDGFVFDRYTSVSSDKEYSDFETTTLEQLSTYFPEIDGVGIKADLAEFYNMWQTFADNPDNGAIKVALAKQTETLSDHITQTQEQVLSLQSQLNEELALSVNDVNFLAEELADLNAAIDVAEAGGGYSANDLRDKRNNIEKKLSELIGVTVNSSQISANTQINNTINTKTGSYTVSVNGSNIVDGSTYHPIHVTKEDNQFGFYEVSYERQDGVLIPLEETIDSGRIGAILDLRGGSLDTTSGMPVDGVIQNTVSEMDSFAKGLIETVNNLYASSSTTSMESNFLEMNKEDAIISTSLNINAGAFDLVVYDIDGNIAAKRAINIDFATVMTGVDGSNSIEGQINAQKDDNGDGNANNDIDDLINFNWTTYASSDQVMNLTLDSIALSQGYTFAIEDTLSDATFSSGTNFAGATGLSRFFDGDSARDIKLNHSLANNNSIISAGSSPSSGDNTVALKMVQHQFESYNYEVGSKSYNSTAYGMFDIIATEVGTETNAAILRNETVTTQFNATELEYFSTSKVSIDEEMTNLIKYQTSYGAAAKVITTIDQMMQTLLGIKS